MSLFNTKKETNKQPINEIQKAKGKRAKTAQQTIPYEEVYPNGIIKVAPGLYSKSYYFGDMNFTTEKEDKQEEILKKYSKLLSKYAPNVTAQFTIFNRRTSAAKIKERFLLKPKSDDQQIFRDDYNKILADKIEEGRNDIQKERYMTLTLKTTDIIMANRTFATLDEETDNAVREINKTGVRPLTIEERICILHDIYKVGEEDFFPDLLKDYYDDENKFSLEVLRKRGLTTKDLIAPGNYMNGTMQIQLGDHNYAKTFLITNFPTAMDTSFLSEISNIPCSMLTSVIFKSYPHKKAIKDVKAQNSAIKSEVVKANQKAVKGNYDPSLISEDLLTAREEAADLVRDVTIHNQKLFFTTVTVTLLATSLDELKEYSNILQMRISDFSCQANSLLGQQTAGLKTSLPLAMNYTEIDRMLTADSIDALFPFSVQELMDKNGHFYGLNAVTQNMIIYNRRDKKSKVDSVSAVNYMLNHFYDVRMFGAVLSTGKLKDTNAHVTGAVQISYGVSEDPIYIRQTKCVRNAHTTEARGENAGGEFATKPVVEFGLYKAFGRYMACQGKKNAVTDEDLALLFETICSMYDNDLSACRNGMCTEKLVVFKHGNERATGSLKKYADRVKVEKVNDEDYPHSMDDYKISVNMENMPKDVEIFAIDL